MNIAWIGHACFLIEAREGRILTDPFGVDVPYDFPDLVADVVTVSHDHFDHNAVDRVGGNPAVVKGTGEHTANGISFSGIAAVHDPEGGAKRGKNTLFVFTLEGIPVAHLGDLGTVLDATQTRALNDVEVLFIPVGGCYTIGAQQATKVVRGLPNVKVVIPMHFKTDRTTDWPIDSVDEFERTMDNAQHLGSCQAVVVKKELPESTEVWILDYARSGKH
jgi:L-ascorbate metabolism protein UlaG (beta-lactamase superfamily)